MEHIYQIKTIFINFCDKALNGTLKLEDLDEIRIKEKDENPFFRQIYEDIEDGVEHLPGTWITGKINYEAWHRTDTYLKLYLDSILLTLDKNFGDLLRCREFVLQGKILSKENLENKVKEFFKKS